MLNSDALLTEIVFAMHYDELGIVRIEIIAVSTVLMPAWHGWIIEYLQIKWCQSSGPYVYKKKAVTWRVHCLRDTYKPQFPWLSFIQVVVWFLLGIQSLLEMNLKYLPGKPGDEIKWDLTKSENI